MIIFSFIILMTKKNKHGKYFKRNYSAENNSKLVQNLNFICCEVICLIITQ